MKKIEKIDLLKEQELFKDISKSDKEFWNKLYKCSKIKKYKKNSIVIKKDTDTTDIFLILRGSIDVLKNNKKIAHRKAKDAVGEIGCLFKDIKRTADCRVAEQSILAKISSSDFKDKILKNNDIIYRRVANILANKLREKIDSIKVNVRKKPVVFIASSNEGKNFVKVLEHRFKKNKKDCILQPWFSPKSFIVSETTIKNLEQTLDNVDFSIIIFTPDDKVEERGKKYISPRDNLIFELGLSYSKLGRDRTFLIKTDSNIKILTDIKDVKYLTKHNYYRQIVNQVKKLGPKEYV